MKDSLEPGDSHRLRWGRPPSNAAALAAHAGAARQRLAAWPATPRGERAVLLAMLLALALFYRASTGLPLTALGLALFAALALLRPDLALRFVPLTVPLFFMPKGVWDSRFGIRDTGVRVPLHEIVLLVTLAATAACWLWRRLRGWAGSPGSSRPYSTALPTRREALRSVRANAPWVLFLLAGTLGVLVAQPAGRGAALREWRWLIVEPLLFYGLIKVWWPREAQARAPDTAPPLLYPFLIGGALVALLGVLQFLGLNLVPYIGTKVGFSDDLISVEGVRRVSSVYGHPNNLGLYMDRVWPLAASFALSAIARGRGRRDLFYGRDLLFVLCALLAIGAVLVSFSKGALLGGLAAAVVLVLTLGVHLPALRSRWLLAVAGAALLAFAAALALGVERVNPLGTTSAIRLSIWASALAMLRDHPILGIGLDQFGLLYPRYIDPALANSNEVFASHPHNLLLDIWLRMGLLGLVAFAGLLLRFHEWLRPGWRPGRPSPLAAGLAAAMAAALVHGLVDNFYFVPDLAFAFWLALALAEAA